MLTKIKSLLVLFKRGQVVADPKKWKTRQITSTVLIAFIWAAFDVLKAFGYDIAIDDETVNNIALGLISVTNLMLTVTTTDKVGV